MSSKARSPLPTSTSTSLSISSASQARRTPMTRCSPLATRIVASTRASASSSIPGSMISSSTTAWMRACCARVRSPSAMPPSTCCCTMRRMQKASSSTRSSRPRWLCDRELPLLRRARSRAAPPRLRMPTGCRPASRQAQDHAARQTCRAPQERAALAVRAGRFRQPTQHCKYRVPNQPL